MSAFSVATGSIPFGGTVGGEAHFDDLDCVLRDSSVKKDLQGLPPSAVKCAVEAASMPAFVKVDSGRRCGDGVGKKATLEAGKRKLEEFKRKKQAALAAKKVPPKSQPRPQQAWEANQQGTNALSDAQVPAHEEQPWEQRSSSSTTITTGQPAVAGRNAGTSSSQELAWQNEGPADPGSVSIGGMEEAAAPSPVVVPSKHTTAVSSYARDHQFQAQLQHSPRDFAPSQVAGYQSDGASAKMAAADVPAETYFTEQGPPGKPELSRVDAEKGQSVGHNGLQEGSWEGDNFSVQLLPGISHDQPHGRPVQLDDDAIACQQPAWAQQAAAFTPSLDGTPLAVPSNAQPSWLEGPGAVLHSRDQPQEGWETVEEQLRAAEEPGQYQQESKHAGHEPLHALLYADQGSTNVPAANSTEAATLAASEVDADVSFWDTLQDGQAQAVLDSEAWQGWGSDAGDWRLCGTGHQEVGCAPQEVNRQPAEHGGSPERPDSDAETARQGQEQSPPHDPTAEAAAGAEGQMPPPVLPLAAKEVHVACSIVELDAADEAPALLVGWEGGREPALGAPLGEPAQRIEIKPGGEGTEPVQPAGELSGDAWESHMQDTSLLAFGPTAEERLVSTQAILSALDMATDGGCGEAHVPDRHRDGLQYGMQSPPEAAHQASGIASCCAQTQEQQEGLSQLSAVPVPAATPPLAAPQIWRADLQGGVPPVEGIPGQCWAAAQQQQAEPDAKQEVAQLAGLKAQLTEQQAASEAAAARAELLAQEKGRLETLLEQHDLERQHLQREKAEMLGELVMLRSASEQPEIVDKETAKALKQAQQQLIVEQQRCADLLEQLEMIAQRAQQEESFHREQVEKLLARLEAAESLEAANKPSQPAAAEQPPLTDPQATVLKYAELEQQLEQLKQDNDRLVNLLERVDAERQQLQREKAAMAGELVLLRAGDGPPAGAGKPEHGRSESRIQNQVAELERQLADALAQLEVAQSAAQHGEQDQPQAGDAQSIQQQLVEAQQLQQQWVEYSQYWEVQATALQERVAQLEAQQTGAEALGDFEGGAASPELAAWQARCVELELLSEQLRQAEQELRTKAETWQQRCELLEAKQQGNAAAARQEGSVLADMDGGGMQGMELQLEQAHKELAHFGAELADAHAELAEIKAKHVQELTEQQALVDQLRQRCSELEASSLAAEHAQRQSEAHAAVAEQHAEHAQQAQQELLHVQHAHAAEVAELLAEKAGAEQRAQQALQECQATGAEVESLKAQLAAAKQAQSILLAEVSPLKAHGARLEAEVKALQHVASQASSLQASGGSGRLEDAAALRTRLDKAEVALEKERRALQSLEKQLSENQQAADEGRLALQDLHNTRSRCDDLERQLAFAKVALQQEQERAPQLLQAQEQGGAALQQAAAAEQAQLAARAAEERAAASDAVALELGAQCESAGATLGKLVEENSQLAERLNWQSGEIARLRDSLGKVEEGQGFLGQQGSGGEGAGEDGVLVGREEASKVWELADGVQLSESDMQLLALAEEVEKLQQALEMQSGRSAQLELQLAQHQRHSSGHQSIAEGSAAAPAGPSGGNWRHAVVGPQPMSGMGRAEQHGGQVGAVWPSGQQPAGTGVLGTGGQQGAGSQQVGHAGGDVPLDHLPVSQKGIDVQHQERELSSQLRSSRKGRQQKGFSFWQWVSGADIAGEWEDNSGEFEGLQ